MPQTPRVIYFHLDEIFRTTFAQVLRRESMVVRVVESTQLLHSYLEVLRVDIILLDEYFLDECYALSCQHPVFPKLLVFTSKRSAEKHQDFKNRGADDLIVMPEHTNLIIDKIKRLCL